MNERATITIFAAVAIVLFVVGMVAGQGLAVGVLVCVPLAWLSSWFCRRLDPRGESGLMRNLLIAIMLRWSVAAFVHLVIYPTKPGLFSPDEIGYDYWGMLLREHLSGNDFAPPAANTGVVW